MLVAESGGEQLVDPTLDGDVGEVPLVLALLADARRIALIVAVGVSVPQLQIEGEAERSDLRRESKPGGLPQVVELGRSRIFLPELVEQVQGSLLAEHH